MSSLYHQQVQLLLEVLPELNKYPCFALKGGTAINLFLHNMPRLSVDIDLCYLPIEDRTTTLINMTQTLKDFSDTLKQKGPFKIKALFDKTETQIIKLLVSKNHIQIKIEPNFILRGSVFPAEKKGLCKQAQDAFFSYFKVNSLSAADLYAGKMCAALDRQHPRDLFDIKIFFEHEGITEDIRKAFVIYLASSPRPMHELLQPNNIDLQKTFENEFVGIENHRLFDRHM